MDHNSIAHTLDDIAFAKARLADQEAEAAKCRATAEAVETPAERRDLEREAERRELLARDARQTLAELNQRFSR